jgi:hypothetical protein
MNDHPDIGGLWDVSDVQVGLNINVSVHQSGGVRQLVLDGQQTAPTLTPEVETRILNWLDNLSSQPAILR